MGLILQPVAYFMNYNVAATIISQNQSGRREFKVISLSLQGENDIHLFSQ